MNQKAMTVEELVALAIKFEEEGEAFYQKMAQKAPAQATQDIFHKLAEEEKEHAQTFRRMFQTISKDLQGAKEVDLAYLWAAVGKTMAPLTKEKDLPPKEALAIGIQAEKDSILFYTELSQHAVSEEVKNTLEKILKAEKLHLMDLRNYYEDME